MQIGPRLIRCLLSAAAVLLAAACEAGGTAAIRPGSRAPDYALDSARGGSFRSQDLRGQVVLLAFLDSQAEASPTPEPSRSQLVFLKSMLEQYGPSGMVVVIVDAARLRTGKQPPKDDLVNFTYDWQLEAIPVLVDPESETARTYGIAAAPTTFLIGADGIIRQRWDGSVTAPQLALAIEALIGVPAALATSAATPASGDACLGEAPSQARFPGVGLARSLSSEIWVVDSGQSWRSGDPFPLQWIFIDEQNLAGDGPVTLSVVARYPASDDPLDLVHLRLWPLPFDEARGLLAGETGRLPKVYLLPLSVSLEDPGCLQVDAQVFRDGLPTAIYSGRAIVGVD